MTNRLLDSIPRYDLHAGDGHSIYEYPEKEGDWVKFNELRALLDAPKKPAEGFEEWAERELGLPNRRISSGGYQSFGMACAEKAWNSKPAAQPQGDPVVKP